MGQSFDGLSDYAQRGLGFYYAGEYEDAIEYCERLIRYGIADPKIHEILIDASSSLGQYDKAAEVAALAAEEFEGYFPIQVRSVEALRAAGRIEDADEILETLDKLAKEADPKRLNAEELVALGKAALLFKADPKMVLAQFFQKARKLEPRLIEGHIAAAEIAIAKADYAIAARVLGEARTKIGPFPDILYLLAKAYAPSDREKAKEFIELALDRNARHVPTILLRAEFAFDAEDYPAAGESIEKALEINSLDPTAWAMKAAIAHIEDRSKDAKEARGTALKPWPKNPEIDYLIGLKVSEKRRFDEGSEFLRKALEFDPAHYKARKVLGENLLRLGREEEGWKLLSALHEEDKYDVEVYNLMLLHDQLEKFEVIESEDFVVRMKADEAAVYGARVVELLDEANETLSAKYGFKPEERVVVDFFPDQQDFAVRTLGIPGGLGIVGACFGNVVAMNSPGSPGAMATNWESTLWHEYCHVVTLGATRNRIPRWLTEGISVYEERTRDKSCGHKMTPEFRRRILEEDGMIPISGLSGALTAFNDPGTIGFAYFEASLLVEYILEKYGASSLRRVLDDLQTNADVERAFSRRVAKLDKLESGFFQFARDRARKTAPKADWSVPEEAELLQRNPEGVAEFLNENPNNLWALAVRSRYLLSEGDWAKLKETGERLIELNPETVGPDSGYAMVAQACRSLEDEEGERKVLEAWGARDGDASDAFVRLMELDTASGNWESVETNARRQLAVNPLLRLPHRALGLAAQELGKKEAAVAAFRCLLGLDPVNPADIHFRLATLQKESDPALARRHVLQAIEEAPRYREAHALFLSLDNEKPKLPESE